MKVTEPLRAEHRAMLPAIDDIKAAADAIGDAPPAEVRALLERSHRCLTDHVIPHAHAEEVALYPAVGRVLGASTATATMSRDHVEILRMNDRLGRILGGPLELDDPSVRQLRALLYGLHAIVRLHLAKEEEVYLPLLDEHLSDHEAAEMFRAMEHAVKIGRRGH